MGGIVDFHGLTTAYIEPDKILEAAKGKLVDCLVIGWDEHGELYYAPSSAEMQDQLWLLKNAERDMWEMVPG